MGALAEGIDIVEVVERRYGVRLQPCGQRLRGLCPLHEESTPSFDVMPLEQRFYCFGCRKHGDVLELIQQMEHLNSAYEAREVVIGAGLDHAAPQVMRVAVPPYEPSDEDLAAVHIAADLYGTELRAGNELAEAYLRQRGLDRDFALSRGIGFGGGGRRLAQQLAEHHVSAEAAQRVGLLSKNGYEYMQERLVLPHQEGGSVRWLCGRIADTPRWYSNADRRAQAPREEHARLSQSLEGESDPEARSGIRDRMADLSHLIGWLTQPPKYHNIRGPKPVFWRPDHVPAMVLVEGPLDAVVLQQWDIPAAAVLGSSLTRRQLESLRGVGAFMLGRDAGDNGREFAEGWAQALRDDGRVVLRIVEPPGGVGDPGALAGLPNGRELAAVYAEIKLIGRTDAETESRTPSLDICPARMEGASTGDAFAVGSQQRMAMVVCPHCRRLTCGVREQYSCCGAAVTPGEIVVVVTIAGSVEKRDNVRAPGRESENRTSVPLPSGQDKG